MSAALIESLKRRNASLQAECDALSGGIDNLAGRLAQALNALAQHDPALAQMLADLNPKESPAPADPGWVIHDPNVKIIETNDLEQHNAGQTIL